MADQIAVMHRLDDELRELDYDLSVCQIDSDSIDIKKKIAAREEALKPVYLQAATEFADLHDKTGRMKAKGVIRSAVPWEEAREFFFYRAKRRILEDAYSSELQSADPALTKESAGEALKELFSGDWEDDKAVGAFLEESADVVADKVKAVKAVSVQAKIDALK